MSQLLVDMGNTRLKWASLVGGVLQPTAALVHRDQSLPELLAQTWSGIPAPDRVLIACVAGELKQQALAAWIKQHWGCEADFLLSPAQGNGLRNRYANPQQLGSDRWAAMVAARALMTDAVCVVNCGSAVTIDVVDPHGQHQGGLILPGLPAMLEALAARTHLPQMDIPAPGKLPRLADSTHDAIAAGAVLAIVGAIERTIAELSQHERLPYTCYLSGGDAALVSANLAVAHQVIPDLVLQGLAIIAQST